MRIAKIVIGDPGNKKGFFNNAIERTRFLQEVVPDVDSFLIRLQYGFILRLLKGKLRRQEKEEYSIVEGLRFKNIWIKLTLFDYLLTYKLYKRPIPCMNQLKQTVSNFRGYDLISPHGLEAIFLAAAVKKKYNIPFVSTWHGSEINVWPFLNKYAFHLTKQLLEFSNHNFFVSKKLLETSGKITACNNKDILYTGPAKVFYKYTKTKKEEELKKLNISSKFVIGFIGNFAPIKNVLVLPLIFKRIQNRLKNVTFIVVGDGQLGGQLDKIIKLHHINNIRFLGKIEPQRMPDIINCLDVVVLPSLNEGMPRVTLEALACGVHVVGSNMGGIPESIGKNNCFALDDSFVVKISDRIIEMLIENETPNPLSEEFSWDIAVQKEVYIYQAVLGKKD